MIRIICYLLFVLVVVSCQGDQSNQISSVLPSSEAYSYVRTNSLGYEVQTDTIEKLCFSAKAVANSDSYFPFTIYNYCDTLISYRFNDSITHTFLVRNKRYSKSWNGEIEKIDQEVSDSISLRLWLPELPSPGVEADISVLRLGPGQDSIMVYNGHSNTNEVNISFLKENRPLDSVVILFEFENIYMDLTMEPLPAKFAFVQLSAENSKTPKP